MEVREGSGKWTRLPGGGKNRGVKGWAVVIVHGYRSVAGGQAGHWKDDQWPRMTGKRSKGAARTTRGKSTWFILA